MELTLKRFKTNDKKLFNMASEIRDVVFCKEQKVEKEIEFDGLDDEAEQYLVFADDTPIATSRWRLTEKGVKLERYAVLKQYRGIGAAKMLLLSNINDTRKYKKPIYLNAQITAQKFYEKYGFVPKGNIFWEANIKHVTMYYEP